MKRYTLPGTCTFNCCKIFVASHAKSQCNSERTSRVLVLLLVTHSNANFLPITATTAQHFYPTIFVPTKQSIRIKFQSILAFKEGAPFLFCFASPQTPLCVSKFVHSRSLTITLIAVLSLNSIVCAVNMCLMSIARAHGGRHARLCVHYGRFGCEHVLDFCRGRCAPAALTLWHLLIIKKVREAQRRAISRVFVHLAFSG